MPKSGRHALVPTTQRKSKGRGPSPRKLSDLYNQGLSSADEGTQMIPQGHVEGLVSVEKALPEERVL